MFSINQNTRKIYITKGDNASLKVNLKERQIFKDDQIKLSVSKYSGEPVLFEKIAAADGVISIVPEDTKSLPIGYYIYDVQLTTFGGKIYTIVPPSTFEIGMEVSE